jgi:hypothetical protein
MNSSLLQFRWAIVLAALQGTIFATVCISEHQRNLRYNHKRDSTHIEYFGCFSLPRQRISNEERWDLAYVDCFPAPSIKLVVLASFPVFIIWGGFAELTRNTNVDQLWLFYVINGFGIPVFWFCTGSLIDRRRLRKAAAFLDPPMDQD